MLLNLPLEILFEIVFYLPVSEKLQLVLTCKKLKDAIFDRCLYETLDMFYDNEKTEFIVSKFQNNPSHCQQVKVLKIHLDRLSNQLFRNIPLIFPNVVEFCDYSNMENTRPECTFSEFMNWTDTLTCATYSYECRMPKFMYNLLEKNIFSHLTTFVLPPIINVDESQIHFLECIKNAPALEHLSLQGITVTLEDVESIHSYCTLLATLDMTFCVIIVTEDEPLPKEIMPTLRLSHFTLTSTSICDQQCAFLSYLTRKYIKLVKLKLDFDFLEGGLEALFPYQSLEQARTTEDFFARSNELYLTQELYTASASNILSDLPSTLRELLITSSNLHNIMALFIKKCINITRLEFIGDVDVCDISFTYPEDIRLFKNFYLLKHLSMMVDPSLQKSKKSPVSISVTHLEVIIKGSSEANEMDIGWILSMFFSLKSLNIKYSGARLIGCESVPATTYPNLLQLFIGPSATHSSLLPFIRATAPNLQDLHWKFFGKYVKENLEGNHLNGDIIIRSDQPEMNNNIAYYRIDLSGLFLNRFHLDIDLRKDARENDEGILLIIKKKDKTKVWFLLQEDARGVRLMDYMSEEAKTKIKTKIIIQCNYTKTIDINSCALIGLEKSWIQLKYQRFT